MKKKNQEQGPENVGEYPEQTTNLNQEHLELKTEDGQIIDLTEEPRRENQMKKEEEKMPCAKCGQEMKLIAKGPRGRRLWGCYNCSSNPKEPQLYFQPTDIYALRPLEQKPLIDMGFRHQNTLEQG